MSRNPLRSTALLALVFAAAALPSSARAQEAANPGNPVPAAATATNPALLGPQVAPVDFVRWAPPSPFDEAPPQDRGSQVPNIAMMAVGVGAIVAGFIIGGDGGMVIAGAGGVVGLIGLWRYLR
ncbi:MAG: hypothetical protein ACYC6F_08045 [Longimicrobiales bacterium]